MATHPRPGRSRPEPRLDPVRWRRPGRGSFLRLAAVAALLAVAATVVLSRPQTCAAPAPVARGQAAAQSDAPPGRGATAPPDTGAGPAALTSHTSAGSAPEPGSAPRNGGPAVPPGTVGVPVRLAEPTALTLVRPGDKVDLLRVDDTGQGGATVADAALVLSVTGADDPTAGGLLLALRPAEAAKAISTPGRGFAILIRPG
jgi:hypothetical protein